MASLRAQGGLDAGLGAFGGPKSGDLNCSGASGGRSLKSLKGISAAFFWPRPESGFKPRFASFGPAVSKKEKGAADGPPFSIAGLSVCMIIGSAPPAAAMSETMSFQTMAGLHTLRLRRYE